MDSSDPWKCSSRAATDAGRSSPPSRMGAQDPLEYANVATNLSIVTLPRVAMTTHYKSARQRARWAGRNGRTFDPEPPGHGVRRSVRPPGESDSSTLELRCEP